jgi:hypothetical protein
MVGEVVTAHDRWRRCVGGGCASDGVMPGCRVGMLADTGFSDVSVRRILNALRNILSQNRAQSQTG